MITPPVKPNILHNVHDHRIGWIGSWEVEPLPTILGPEYVGRTVIYKSHIGKEAGTITSWRDGLVFARYNRGDTAAGANVSDLVLGVKGLTIKDLGNL